MPRLCWHHGADAVKLEGGIEQVETIRRLTAQGISVCGHIGFTPQTLHQPGRKARVQGRSFSQAIALLESAIALEQAGAQLLVLELIPEPLGKAITECLRIPTIGIGAGRFCDGQVLIIHDLLGLTPFHLRFVKRYQQYRELTLQAIAAIQARRRATAFSPAATRLLRWMRTNASRLSSGCNSRGTGVRGLDPSVLSNGALPPTACCCWCGNFCPSIRDLFSWFSRASVSWERVLILVVINEAAAPRTAPMRRYISFSIVTPIYRGAFPGAAIGLR